MSAPQNPTQELPASSDAFAAAPAEAAEAPGVALLHWASHARFWIIAVLGLSLDLYSKEWAFHTLRQDGPPLVLIPGVLTFQTMFNPGALFGIGRGQTALFLVASVLALALVLWMFAQSASRRWLLHIALGAILAGALGNMYDRVFVQLVQRQIVTSSGPAIRYFVIDDSPEADGSASAEGVILREYPPIADGRAIRISRQRLPDRVGYVRDFIKINSTVAGRELWPWVFNVADTLLVGGVIVLAVYLWRDRRPAPETAAATAA